MDHYDGHLCVCPSCGTELYHRRGFPCFRETCPSCGHAMQRSSRKARSVPRRETNQASLVLGRPPRVIVEDCISCGICLDACEFDAVIYRDGKAFVKAEDCTLCGECLYVCPRDAIKE